MRYLKGNIVNETNESLIKISKDLHHHTQNLHVLYVEDSATMRHATQKQLAPYFDHIDSAADGILGLELYRKFHLQHEKNYDIVITDLEMPNMDGQELSRAIFSIDPNQEVIIISASNELGLLIDLLNMGVRKFLAKPIIPQQLHDTISDVAQLIRLKKIKADELNDITEHNLLLKKREEIYLKKLEKNYKELEEFNSALNESAIVSKTDPNGIITYVNQKFCDVSGYTSDELIGIKHNILKCDDMAPSFYQKLWHRITSKKIHTGIFKNRSKDGNVYYIDQLIKPIITVEGDISEFIGIGYDITKMMESIEIAKQAQESKDDFFRNISHEMRTPLNAILGLTSLLQRRAKDDTKLYDMLGIIESNSQSLANLVESILDLQRLQHNDLELQLKEFEVTALYTSIIVQNKAKALEKNVEFHYAIDSDVPTNLLGDFNRLQQIIMAIVDNAIKFSLKYGSVNFHISYSHDDSLLMIQISDSGIGISPQNQEKIFQLTQLDGSLSRKYEGSGIGLTIANSLVKKMGGTITIDSAPNQGSTFLIEIPLKKP
jgi:PAS domain S-box-containing protein